MTNEIGPSTVYSLGIFLLLGLANDTRHCVPMLATPDPRKVSAVVADGVRV